MPLKDTSCVQTIISSRLYKELLQLKNKKPASPTSKMYRRFEWLFLEERSKNDESKQEKLFLSMSQWGWRLKPWGDSTPHRPAKLRQEDGAECWQGRGVWGPCTLLGGLGNGTARGQTAGQFCRKLHGYVTQEFPREKRHRVSADMDAAMLGQ